MNRKIVGSFVLATVLVTGVNAVDNLHTIQLENYSKQNTVEIQNSDIISKKDYKEHIYKLLDSRQTALKQLKVIRSKIEAKTDDENWLKVKRLSHFLEKSISSDYEIIRENIDNPEKLKETLSIIYKDLIDEMRSIERVTPAVKKIDREGSIYKGFYSIYEENEDAIFLVKKALRDIELSELENKKSNISNTSKEKADFKIPKMPEKKDPDFSKVSTIEKPKDDILDVKIPEMPEAEDPEVAKEMTGSKFHKKPSPEISKTEISKISDAKDPDISKALEEIPEKEYSEKEYSDFSKVSTIEKPKDDILDAKIPEMSEAEDPEIYKTDSSYTDVSDIDIDALEYKLNKIVNDTISREMKKISIHIPAVKDLLVRLPEHRLTDENIDQFINKIIEDRMKILDQTIEKAVDSRAVSIDGVFVQFDEGKFDWLYVKKDSGDVYKLDGVSDSGSFRYQPISSLKGEVQGDEVLIRPVESLPGRPATLRDSAEERIMAADNVPAGVRSILNRRVKAYPFFHFDVASEAEKYFDKAFNWAVVTPNKRIYKLEGFDDETGSFIYSSVPVMFK